MVALESMYSKFNALPLVITWYIVKSIFWFFTFSDGASILRDDCLNVDCFLNSSLNVAGPFS